MKGQDSVFHNYLVLGNESLYDRLKLRRGKMVGPGHGKGRNVLHSWKDRHGTIGWDQDGAVVERHMGHYRSVNHLSMLLLWMMTQGKYPGVVPHHRFWCHHIHHRPLRHVPLDELEERVIQVPTQATLFLRHPHQTLKTVCGSTSKL